MRSMALIRNRLAVASALAATITMTASPALAADLPLPRHAHAAAPADEIAQNRHWRHRDQGIDGGDILAGVLILGGIAAIASAASNADRQSRSYPDDYRSGPRPYPEDSRYRAPAADRGYQGGGMDRAVDMCVNEVERRAEVVAVDGANRTGEGWFVSGETATGAPWSCRIGNDGRIADVAVGDDPRGDGASYSDGYSDSYAGNGSSAYSGPAGAQYDDETYARARASAGMSPYSPRVPGGY
jgi:hypothetical protein